MNNHFNNYPTIQIPLLLRFLRKFDFPHKKGILRRMFGSSLSRQGIGWASTWTGTEWLIDCRSSCDQWMVFDRYADSNFLKWVEKNVTQNGCIIDSGSNIGQFIPYFSRLVPNGNVVGFEPSSKLHQWLRACIDRADLSNVEIIQKGLGDKAAMMELISPDCEYTHGGWGTIVAEGGDEEVMITTLDNETSTRNINEIALWKLDVEGYEVPALTGAADLLQSRKINAVYIELWRQDDNYNKIISLMNNFKYRPYLFHKTGLRPLKDFQTAKSDALFLP